MSRRSDFAFSIFHFQIYILAAVREFTAIAGPTVRIYDDSTLVPANRRARQRGWNIAIQIHPAAGSLMSGVLHQLMAVLEDRKVNPPPNSYTARLYAGGDAKIGAKISEEAQELVEAASEPIDPGRRHMIHETTDVLYHLLVLLAYHGIKLEEVEAEIARRFGQSGLDEKAARTATVAK